MNATNHNMNPDDAQPHNPKLPMVAAEHMGKKLVELVLQELRVAPDVWQKMSEKQQQESIERIQHSVKYATAGAVNTIVTGGHTALAGTIESIAKKDKIKLTVIIDRNNNSDAMHEFYLADSGASCQILMADAAQYLGSMDLVEADPDQGQLFGGDAPSLPDDAFLWAINLPLMSGGASMIPAPSRKDAELFARSIREKLYEMDQVEYAKSVYAHLWPLNNGEHMRSFNKGNWEAMINWFGRLCKGEVDVAPVALIGHSPETEAVAVLDDAITVDFDTIVVTKKGMDFIACSFGDSDFDEKPEGKSVLSAEDALKKLAAKQAFVGEWRFEEVTTAADELKQSRVFTAFLTFSASVYPELEEEARRQREEAKMGGMIDSFIEQEWPSESVATDDEVTAEKPKGRAVKPRYANPETGETWTGRGKQPAWLVAKIAEGASIDDFLIQ